MKYRKYKVGDKVYATKTITEDGVTPPDATAKFPNRGYVHARVGDVGIVEYIDEDGCPTVRFSPQGTSTVVGDHEVEMRHS